jgi:hypothetical protein
MNLNKQTCTKEQADKLVSLGVKIGSVYCITSAGQVWTKAEANHCDLEWTTLFGVADLLNALPEKIEVPNTVHSASLVIEKDYDYYGQSYVYTAGYKIGTEWYIGSGTSNAAESLADVLLILLRDRLATVASINNWETNT